MMDCLKPLTYGGGHIQLIGNQYFKFPLSEAVLWGLGWAC